MRRRTFLRATAALSSAAACKTAALSRRRCACPQAASGAANHALRQQRHHDSRRRLAHVAGHQGCVAAGRNLPPRRCGPQKAPHQSADRRMGGAEPSAWNGADAARHGRTISLGAHWPSPLYRGRIQVSDLHVLHLAAYKRLVDLYRPSPARTCSPFASDDEVKNGAYYGVSVLDVFSSVAKAVILFGLGRVEHTGIRLHSGSCWSVALPGTGRRQPGSRLITRPPANLTSVRSRWKQHRRFRACGSSCHPLFRGRHQLFKAG